MEFLLSLGLWLWQKWEAGLKHYAKPHHLEGWKGLDLLNPA